MKNILLFVACLFFIDTCFSQDVIERKNRLTTSVTERYHAVIGSNKEVRQGTYEAAYNKIPVATGQYTNNKKTGIWHFYSKFGKPIEEYNYDTNTLLFEAPEDSTSSLRYFVDETLKPTDRTTKPIKIGGRYYAYLPYLKMFKLPTGISNTGNEGYSAQLEILVSPGGRLADYKIHFRQGKNEDIYHINTDQLKEEDKQFMPATLNGQPVTCRIFIQCYLNNYDEIDMLF